MIRFLIFLAKLVGRMALILSVTQSALGRTQTRILTAAQRHGWHPSDAEAGRLMARQTNLWLRDASKRMQKKLARDEEQIFLDPPKNQTGNNLKNEID